MNTLEQSYARLHALMMEISHLQSAYQSLEWDNAVGNVPAAAHEAHAELVASLWAQAHEKQTSAEYGDLVARLLEDADDGNLGPIPSAIVRAAWIEHDWGKRLPTEFVARLTELQVRTHKAWEAARVDSSWRTVLPLFAELVVLTREKALLLHHGSEPYDALLEEYEEGLTADTLHRQLDGLREALKPLLSGLRHRSGDMCRADRNELASIRSVPIHEQRHISLGVASALGFDPSCGRFAESAHPFTTQVNRHDVRFTAAYREKDAFFGISCAVHEMGHWLHAQGVDDALYGTPAGESSFTVSEGVARFYEVIIGLGLPFMEWLMPRLPRQVSPQVACRALNYPVGNGIRLDATDAEYDLCIAMRVTIERPLVNGSLLPHEVPDAWNALSFDHLGVAPTDHARGVLQDDHWFAGSFGYFGTYSRGNMFASQLEAAMRRDMPDLDEVIRRGEFAHIGHWLWNKVFRHGGLMTTAELARHATGAELSIDAHLARIMRRYAVIFG